MREESQNSWTRPKHRVGRERPHFRRPSAAQKFVGSLPPFHASARGALAALRKSCHAGCHATCLTNLKSERRKEVAHPESTTQTIEECKPADSYRGGCPTQARQIRRIHRYKSLLCRQRSAQASLQEGC